MPSRSSRGRHHQNPATSHTIISAVGSLFETQQLSLPQLSQICPYYQASEDNLHQNLSWSFPLLPYPLSTPIVKLQQSYRRGGTLQSESLHSLTLPITCYGKRLSPTLSSRMRCPDGHVDSQSLRKHFSNFFNSITTASQSLSSLWKRLSRRNT